MFLTTFPSSNTTAGRQLEYYDAYIPKIKRETIESVLNLPVLCNIYYS